MKQHRYAVYIMASRSHNLYIGMTNDVVRRVREHKDHVFEGFTDRYNIDCLVWYEVYPYVRTAIAREKQLKGWVREKKIRLIEAMNPTWQDLAEDWGKPIPPLRADRRSFDSGAQKTRASAQDDSLDAQDDSVDAQDDGVNAQDDSLDN